MIKPEHLEESYNNVGWNLDTFHCEQSPFYVAWCTWSSSVGLRSGRSGGVCVYPHVNVVCLPPPSRARRLTLATEDCRGLQLDQGQSGVTRELCIRSCVLEIVYWSVDSVIVTIASTFVCFDWLFDVYLA